MIVPDPVSPGLDWVKILDFGIAKVGEVGIAPGSTARIDVKTCTGAYMGTPRYMAPEQHGGAEKVDGKADVFSLGVMLYEMLAGKLPYKTSALSLFGTTPAPVDRLQHLVPAHLAALTQRMLAVQPAQRPTMDEVARKLAALIPAPARRLQRRLYWLAGAAGLLLVALLVWGLRPRLPSPGEVKQQARAVLTSFLRDADSNVRVMAVRALGQSRDIEQRSLLEPLIADPKQAPPVVEEAARALGRVGALDAQPALLTLLFRHPDGGVQVAAAGALARLQHPRGTEELKRLVRDRNGELLSGAHKLQAALLLLERGDSTGAPLLWTSIERGGMNEKLRVQVLGRLALSGDERAQRLLSADMTAETHLSGEARIYAAFSLARLGEEGGWSALHKVAAESGPDQLLALRLLASLGESIEQSQLLKVATGRSEPDASRELALAGLADSGRDDSLRQVATLLKERGASARLRIAAAGAILELAAGDRAQLAEQSLSWAQTALDSDSVATRELAVAALGDLNSEPLLEKTIAPLGRALKDHDRGVRKGAARALGRKPARAAVQVLVASADDSDPEVRVAILQSAGKVATVLAGRGDREAEKPLRRRLLFQTTSASELDRIVASGILLQLGDASQSAILRAGLSAQDPLARRLALEMAEPDRTGFVGALQDSKMRVRFATARRLALLSDPPQDALAVLREVATRVDGDGIAAYGLLRKLGEPVPPPLGLGSLLVRADLPTRFAVIQMVPELPPPPDEALRLLQLGLLDPAAVIRRQVAEIAADFYRHTGLLRFLQLVRSLRSDADVIVRAQATILTAELAAVRPFIPPARNETPRVPAEPEQDGQNDAAPAAPAASSAPRTPSPPSAPVKGTLLLAGDELVRIRIDNGQPQTLPGKPVLLTPGRHRISYLGGIKEVQIKPEQTTRLRIPVTAIGQLLHDCQEHISSGEYVSAQEELNHARRLLRGRADPALQAELDYLQGRLDEARGQLREALSAYNRCLRVSATVRGAALNAALQATLARLSPKAGRIQIFTPISGECKMTQELLLLPGEQVISIGQGQTRTVFSQAGSTNKVMACQ